VIQAQTAFKKAMDRKIMKVHYISERSVWDKSKGDDYTKRYPLLNMVVKLGCRTIRKPVPFSCSGVWLPL
jgi:hypothetical protein